MKTSTLPPIPKPPSRIKSYLTFALIVLLLWSSGVKTGADFLKLADGLPNIGRLLGEMVPPDWSYFSKITDAMWETIRMAVAGTTFGAALAIPIALLSARNVARSPFLYYPARFILNLVRTVPDLLLAAVFVAIFGIGPWAGIFALTLFSFGLIAKLTYESVEAIDPGPLEAMTAVGANKLQWIHFGVVPQVTGPFVSYFLYTFEVNVRAAAVLGLVGAGGIGLFYERTLGLLKYDKTSSIILFTLAVVLIIDFITVKVREKWL
ncbi:phosphonate ABC transporter, permease protein PhnE [Cohnella sp. CFH 77786]|uniref:phosphonate ABC transporter, permease protein PhnE n=1 Tax=Cohnella sp. CFH 77786 TaxID=2662265 RepID=UPI001C60D6A2|nr:phosphonate ABC transporter, permease protein PhnE [Cohnella sp. CFH 77786]MBW5448034.1 phosphonate ABC transporter, permease protein PhnE [Cohnella sp. CFH 77786]